MRKRTSGAFVLAILVLALASMGCSISQLLARGPVATGTPTRTPRPTWTPRAGAIVVATPTLDATRFPGVVVPTDPPPTAQPLVPGHEDQIFVPTPGAGAPAVQTVVVVIVTATPEATSTPPPSPASGTPLPTETTGPPTATPTVTDTPFPPVVVEVIVDRANVRQGPGTTYLPVTQLDAGTEVTVVARNHAGDWWKICCVNGVDVWIADSVVKVDGPLWLVPEDTNIPPAPPAPSTPAPAATPAPTPTYVWQFRVEGLPEEYPLGQNIFRVDAIIYNGRTPLWGYRLQITKLSTGETWLSEGSESYWRWIVIQWPDDGQSVNANQDCPFPRTGLICVKSNVKWDSNGINVPMGDDVWEVRATDGAGNPLSAPVRFSTSVAQSKWYYVVFSGRP